MPEVGGGVGHIWADMGHTRPIWGTDPKREDIVDSGGRIGNGG